MTTSVLPILDGRPGAFKHGWARTQTYAAWKRAKQRCSNPNADQYPDYGGRGIKMCDRWLNSFENFLEDMGPRPVGQTLDRRDVNGDYEPQNCRWATNLEQQRNKRQHVFVTLAGEAVPLSVAVAHYGVVAYATARARFGRGWDPHLAAKTPLTRQKRSAS